MIKLIYDNEIAGHHLEYIHHLYDGARKDKNNEYIFAVPESFSIYKNQFEWEKAENISFHYICQSEIEKCEGGGLRGVINETLVANRIIRKLKPNEVFFIFLMKYIPLLPLMLNRHIKISGIIYNIYHYNINSKFRLLFEILRYSVISKRIKKAFILNDIKSVQILNNKYKTDIFKPLVDPIPNYVFKEHGNLVNDIKITKGRTFLHFGVLKKRKGTIDILKAIQQLPENFEATFIFAGKVTDEIKEEFYYITNTIKNQQIIIIDQYCNNDLINDLCYNSDCILIPYYNTGQSSGVLGYAAAHHIPVIGPRDNLLGRLIREYHLGNTIDSITPIKIKEAIINFKAYRTDSYYVNINSISNFVKSIFN